MGESITRKLERSQRSGVGCLVAFGLFFAAFGSFFVWMFVVRPASLAAGARDWVEVPCRILSSEVTVSHDSDSGDTYGIAVSYEYEYNHERFRGDRYDFARISDGDRGAKQRIVNSLPVGATATCWVNPNIPSDSVIDREYRFRWGNAFVFMFPAAGVAMVIFGLRKGRVKGDRPSGVAPHLAARNPAGGVVLKHDLGRQALVLLLAALFWNGIVSVFWIGFSSSGKLNGWLIAFIGLFTVVGLVLMGAAIRKLMQGIAPVPVIHAASDMVPLGGKLILKWHFSRDASPVNQMRLTLIGREEATYRRGTDSVTDKHEFARIPIYEGTSAMRFANGSAQVSIPADTMHSFAARNNKVVWAIELVEDVSNWPDVKCEYAIQIGPAVRDGRAS